MTSAAPSARFQVRRVLARVAYDRGVLLDEALGAHLGFSVDGQTKGGSGPLVDNDNDYLLNVWTGVIPLPATVGELLADSRLKPGIEPSTAARSWAARGATGR
ncbi:MAG: hypothetical protein ACRDRW_19055 [Pseudonocardiaceae bacterium]